MEQKQVETNSETETNLNTPKLIQDNTVNNVRDCIVYIHKVHPNLIRHHANILVNISYILREN